MTGDEAKEVLGIVQRIGPVILSAAINPSGDVGTALRRAVGLMVSDVNMTDQSTFAFALNVCLDLARHSAATLVTMDRVRKAALNEKPVGLPAVLTVNTIVQMALAMEARIIAYMQFSSRDEIDAISTAVNAAYSAASEAASDDLDAGTYMAIITLHGTITLHLAERGRRLPRVINYSYGTVMPALRMAQQAYADPSRYQELISENNVVHPAFMPRDGKMLAV
jgi:prophage DNA circulation protein